MKTMLKWLVGVSFLSICIWLVMRQPGMDWSGVLYFLGEIWEMTLFSFLVIAPLTFTMRYYRHSKRMSKRYFSDYGLVITMWIVAFLTFMPFIWGYLTITQFIRDKLLAWLFPGKAWYQIGDIKTVIMFIVMSLPIIIVCLGFIISQRALPATKINKSVIKRTKMIRWFVVILELLFWRWWIFTVGFFLWLIFFVIS